MVYIFSRAYSCTLPLSKHVMPRRYTKLYSHSVEGVIMVLFDSVILSSAGIWIESTKKHKFNSDAGIESYELKL